MPAGQAAGGRARQRKQGCTRGMCTEGWLTSWIPFFCEPVFLGFLSSTPPSSVVALPSHASNWTHLYEDATGHSFHVQSALSRTTQNRVHSPSGSHQPQELSHVQSSQDECSLQLAPPRLVSGPQTADEAHHHHAVGRL